MNYKKIKIGVIGLGYVGLPLAIEFGKKRNVLGFDINKSRIKSLQRGIDHTNEVHKKDILTAKKLIYTSNFNELKKCNCFIITVPTPIYKNKQPNLKPLLKATENIAKIIKKGDLIIYESTVFPGCTEEECVPILEKFSGLIFNKDFYCGYSPERINPGDKKHRIKDIKKVTSGSTLKVANIVDRLYNEIIRVGTFKAESIKVAEAAKVIENTQRDLNIALVNELSIIFNKMDINTEAVLKAASSKWNFFPFSPGLVGGHCIGVDPYYLTHKAKEIGYDPQIILAGRRLNDSMSSYVVKRLIEHMKKKKIKVKKSKVLILGFTFKENCPDIRNTQKANLYNQLKNQDIFVEVYDPWVTSKEAKKEYGISPIKKLINGRYDAIVLAVNHKKFKEMGPNFIRKLGKENHVLFDLKYVLKSNESDMRL